MLPERGEECRCKGKTPQTFSSFSIIHLNQQIFNFKCIPN